MNKEDVKLGMKVVPHRKSALMHHINNFHGYFANSLNSCTQWQEAKAKGQGFLYVAHQHADDKRNGSERFLLDASDISGMGNYYNASDFEPYVEKDEEEIVNT